MNREEIMLMSPAELREAIAKVKGYECKSKEKINSNGFWVYVSDKLAFEIPNWPENIADAWKLAEEIPDIRLRKLEDGDDLFWRCCCDYSCEFPKITVDEESAPLSISRCWLMWREE
jgi:hypothetical protein